MKNFLSEINERTRSPLIYSFLIAWVIFNWKIPVSLLFEDVKELEAHGYHSHLQFIQAKLNWSSGLVHPLLSALIYTFVFPFVKNVISIFNAWITRWGNKLTLSTLKDGSISISKYIELKVDFEKKANLLSETLKNESVTTEKNKTLESNLYNLNIQYERLNDQLKEISEKTDINLINGFWGYKILDHQNSLIEEGYCYIDRNNLLLTDERSSNRTEIARISLFIYDKPNYSVGFITELTRDGRELLGNNSFFKKTLIFKLTINPEKNILSGTSNTNNKIVMTKFK